MLNLKSFDTAMYTPGVLDDYGHPMADIRVALDGRVVVHKVVADSYWTSDNMLHLYPFLNRQNVNGPLE